MALVLSRQTGERIILTCPNPCELIVDVVRITPTSVRLAFSAPREVVIVREELRGIEVSPERERMIESGAVKPSAVHLREAGA